MADLPTLRTALARLEGATGPDDALDRAIYRMFCPTRVHGASWVHVTASIDAAVALVERALPGETAKVFMWAVARATALEKPMPDILPRLVVSELFRALIAKEEARHD